MLGTEEQPIEDGRKNRQWRYCRCSNCGTVELCTPQNDFYQIGESSPTKELFCEDCYAQVLRRQGVKLYSR